MFEIRKVVTVQETIFREQDIELKQPLHKVAVAAVCLLYTSPGPDRLLH